MSKIISSYPLGSRDLSFYVGIVHPYMHQYFMSTAFALVPILRYVAFNGMNVQLYLVAVKGFRIKMVDKFYLRSNLPSSR